MLSHGNIFTQNRYLAVSRQNGTYPYIAEFPYIYILVNDARVNDTVIADRGVRHNYRVSSRLPKLETTGSFANLMKLADKGKYLAIMAYLHQTPETDRTLARFRRKVTERYKIATTLGYGPRFLHSTGQLYKGGQNTGLFLQLTANHENDLPIPGKPYTFGTVADAQALGDFQALQAAGRQVIRMNLSESKASIMERLLRFQSRRH